MEPAVTLQGLFRCTRRAIRLQNVPQMHAAITFRVMARNDRLPAAFASKFIATRRAIMSASGLDVFDKTLQTTNAWLKEIQAELGPDRQVAWKVLSVVLHKLRDRLPLQLAAHFGAELPLLVRGVYYDQFEPAKQPTDWDKDEFIAEVQRWLSDIRPMNAEQAVHAVFAVLSRHIPKGQIEKVRNALPEGLRQSWLSSEQAAASKRRSDHAA
jgi:uncharacterized protein (DUF2267 family)